MMMSLCTRARSRRRDSEGVGDALLPGIQSWTLGAFAHGLWKKWMVIPDMYSGYISLESESCRFKCREQQGLRLQPGAEPVGRGGAFGRVRVLGKHMSKVKVTQQSDFFFFFFFQDVRTQMKPGNTFTKNSPVSYPQCRW